MSDEVHPIDAQLLADTLYSAIRHCATHLRKDYLDAIETYASTVGPSAGVISSIIENASIGAREDMPICQDTGTVWCWLEIGDEESIPGDVLSGANDAVARAYTDGGLRMSVVKDALFDRSNTMDNTPAFCKLSTYKGTGARLHVLLKGGGSDNASRIAMLPPSAGIEGVMDVVLSCVREKAANACPPLLVGVGVGSTFDKVADLSKQALLRPIGSPAQAPKAAELERELKVAINQLGIGPGALGGVPTCVAVHLNTAPCHIAALPVAVNLGCCAMRSASYSFSRNADTGTIDIERLV